MKRYLTIILLAGLLLALFISAAILYPRLTERDTSGQSAQQGSIADTELDDSSEIPLLNDSSAGYETTDLIPSSNEETPSGEKTLSFTVYDADGNAVSLEDHFGSPIIVNLWASWCPPCRAELPAFDEAYQKYGEQIVFMMVDLADGYQETQEAGQAYVKDMEFMFPVYFDTDLDAVVSCGVYSIPMTLFIRPDGSLQDSHIGSMTEAVLDSYIKELLQ